MRIPATLGIVILIITTLSGLSFVACGDDDETPVSDDADIQEPQPTEKTPTLPEEEELVITIGNLTDMTGPASNAMLVIDMALDDLVRHYNENNIIPSVRLKVIQYDSQMDPSKFIPGYEWLKEKGADFICTSLPGVAITLETLVNDDKKVLFSQAAEKAAFEPPGYVFMAGPLADHEVFTLLKWIAENDWDYQTKGPAKIGGASWDDPKSRDALEAIEQYAEVHPDQFEWISGHLTPMATFTWGPEVDALKDCDYLYPPGIMGNFVKEYRDAGHTAKLIGAGVHFAFRKMIDDAGLWDEIDGMLITTPNTYWNEEDELATLVKQILNEYHPDEAENIIQMGWTYLSMISDYPIVDIVARAVESVGPKSFDTQALFEAASSYTLTVEGILRFSYNESKRYSNDYYGIYEANSAQEDLIRIDPEWYYHVTQP